MLIFVKMSLLNMYNYGANILMISDFGTLTNPDPRLLFCVRTGNEVCWICDTKHFANVAYRKPVSPISVSEKL